MLNLDEITLADCCTPAQFKQQFPDIFGLEDSPRIDRLINERHTNGLEACGAVVEISPKRFLIVKKNFPRWLAYRRSACHVD